MIVWTNTKQPNPPKTVELTVGSLIAVLGR